MMASGVVALIGMPKKRPGRPAQEAASFIRRDSVWQTTVWAGVSATFLSSPTPSSGIGMTPSQVGSCIEVIA
jgi:hypothetical protein